MSDNGKDERGRFAHGNAGGPGRPRRSVEREYLATLGEAVPLDQWREVVARALADAKAGDAAARTWLAKYLLGDKPPKLVDLAADEATGETVDEAIAEAAADKARWRAINRGLFDAMP